MISLCINLYSFHELKEIAKEKAIREHRQFMLNTLQPDYIDGVVDWHNPEKMRMYEDEYQYIEENNEPVIESIEVNEYTFYFDGEICWSCHYTAGEKQGITEYRIHGEYYAVGGDTP